jgi:deazaflavin-dependent oxidoreductase (nitroreductase family)
MPRRSEPAYLYLTTRGRRTGLPREIEIWFTERAGRYYLIAEHRERAQWVRNILAHPPVRWRVGPASFEGRARVLDGEADGALIAAIQARSEEKYGWGDGLVVELTPVSGA